MNKDKNENENENKIIPPDNNEDGVIELSHETQEKISIDSEPVTVKNSPDEKAEKRKRKKQDKKEKKSSHNKKYPHKSSFIIGLIVTIFAIFGIVLIILNTVNYVSNKIDKGTEFTQYNEFLTPIAAVDPDAFDDIQNADSSQLLNAAIWSILSLDSTPDTYSYKDGYMIIPKADVEKSYIALFGPDAVSFLVHKTVNGYNSSFIYDSTASSYKIPITAISPIYTPQVTEAKQSGNTLTITVNYLSSASWDKDADGNFVAPSPDKVMRIVLRENQGKYYISSIQIVSKTVPETVSYEQTTAAVTENNSESEVSSAAGTTVQSAPEKTTLGGRVN